MNPIYGFVFISVCLVLKWVILLGGILAGIVMLMCGVDRMIALIPVVFSMGVAPGYILGKIGV